MLKRILYPIAFMAVALLVFAMLATPRALAAPSALTVDSTLDEPDSNVNDGQCISTPSGMCTLRAAVMQANLFNVDTTILVPSGIYTLTIPPVGLDGPGTGDLNLTTPGIGSPVITISGAGAITTIIDGNGTDLILTDRVFNIGPGRPAIISGVTIRNGSSTGFGGGIFNGGTVTLNNSTLSGNSTTGDGGGILNGGTMTLNNSTLSGNNRSNLRGGGIYNNGGTVTLNNSTLSGNNGGIYGGGIYNQAGNLTLNNSTLSGNSATYGGGIFNASGANNIFVVNSTLSQNSATNDGGGIVHNATGAVNFYNSSIVFNSADTANVGYTAGGVYNVSGAPFNLRNTLVAGNNVTTSPNPDDCTGALNSYGRNLFGTVSGCTVTNMSGASWDYLNSNNTFGPLQNNGGPTFTHALLQGSNAIDGADPVFGCTDYNGATIITDQRGAARVVGVRCDIGAFEYRPPVYLPLIVR